MATINLKTATQKEVDAFVKDAQSFELLAIFNEQSGKPKVNRFSSRSNAVERFTRLAAELRGAPMPDAEPAQEPVVTAPKQKEKKEAAPKPITTRTPEETKAKRSESTSNSWKNPATLAARSARHAVRVDGHEYRSVHAAFVALGLPSSASIKFRMRLKAEGKLTEFGREWIAIEA